MSSPQTQFYGACSLDGYLAGPSDELDWLLQFDAGATGYAEFIAEVGALAMGAATYEWLYRELQPRDGKPAQPWPYPQPAWVFTHRILPTFPGADLRWVAGPVEPVHQAMAAAAGERNRWIVGGGGLVAQFRAAGLLDEVIVQIAPVALGGGKPLWPSTPIHPPLSLTSVRALGTTFAELRYTVPRPPR